MLLYKYRKKFLVKDEKIEFGSQVSQSKMFGFSTDTSVMLLTNQRLLFVDGADMKLKKEFSTTTIQACVATDKTLLTIRFVCGFLFLFLVVDGMFCHYGIFDC